MSASKSKRNRRELLSSLLVKIVLANNGVVTSNDKNSLLEGWLTALGG